MKKAIQHKRRNMLAKGVFLLHDNSRTHMASATRPLLNSFGCDGLCHFPHSPELMPSDGHLLTSLKLLMDEKSFATNEEVSGGGDLEEIKGDGGRFFQGGIKKLNCRLTTFIEIIYLELQSHTIFIFRPYLLGLCKVGRDIGENT